VYAKTDMRQDFMRSKCGENANVRDFLTELHVKKEQLAAVGVVIDDKDYTSTILTAIPNADADGNGITVPKVELYDSGATQHISPYKEDFQRLTRIPTQSLSAANQQKFDAIAEGDMVIDVLNGHAISQLRLTKVLYVPSVGYTLVSIGQLDGDGYTTNFRGGTCTIWDKNGDVVGKIAKTKCGLYKVVHEDSAEAANAVEDVVGVQELHSCLGHVSPSAARRLVESGMVTGLSLDRSKDNEPTFCEACVYAKSTHKSVAKERMGECTQNFGDEVHTDIWGPSPTATLRGRRYYVSFTDDATRYTLIYPMAKKSETFAMYLKYEAWCKTQYGVPIKSLHSDHGGEYLSDTFVKHLDAAGTKQKLTVHDTPQHNGMAERCNRTILEWVCALIYASKLPQTLWAEAATHIVWLMN
jgi:transposase InsO family protein